jgi:hypothetical protein
MGKSLVINFSIQPIKFKAYELAGFILNISNLL